MAVWGVVDNCFCECLGVHANSMAVLRVLNYCDDCLGGGGLYGYTGCLGGNRENQQMSGG